MLPVANGAGALTGIRRDGSAVASTLSTIKGVTYAVFAATSRDLHGGIRHRHPRPGHLERRATATHAEATVTWTTNEPTSSRVDYGLAPGSLTSTASVGGTPPRMRCRSSGLSGGTTYYYRVVSIDAGGLVAVSPVQSFTTATAPTTFQVVDTTAGDFGAGTLASVRIATQAGGEVELGAGVGADFNGDALPDGWTATPWSGGGSGVPSTGQLLVDGALVTPPGCTVRADRWSSSLPSAAEGFQHAGFAITFNEARWAIFSTGGGGALYARTHDGATPTDTLIPGPWLGAPHRYRIEWNADGVVFSIDGTPVATHAAAIGGPDAAGCLGLRGQRPAAGCRLGRADTAACDKRHVHVARTRCRPERHRGRRWTGRRPFLPGPA